MRSHDSFGVGEFNDVKKYSDWANAVGIRLIQVLPVNDTTARKDWHDSYPYAAISVSALHPMYLHLPAVAGEQYASLLKKYEAKRQELNLLSQVDYERVNKAKWEFIREIFPLLKEHTFADTEYEKFFLENKVWLEPYAAFCCLRDTYKTADFTQWDSFAVYDETIATSLLQENEDEIKIHYFVQYYLHLQLKEAVAYAHANNVVVKGDIAIGVYRHSVDAWQYPQWFHMETQAGAPPDDFAVSGQNWGFPTYNWEAIKTDNFTWWRQRLQHMSRYFDVIRIDHILGFFRIWTIPYHAIQGLLGHFEPAIPVRLNELYGMNVSTERLMMPYITDDLLSEIFDKEAAYVKETFLTKNHGNIRFKQEYSTQRKIEEYFRAFENNDYNNCIKKKLYDLLANIILIPTKEKDAFHFRFNMQSTSSYRSLDDVTKSILCRLYEDYYFQRQEGIWQQEAYDKLPAIIQASPMLVCGEDLGMVPKCVKNVMQHLQLLSLEVQRMSKNAQSEFEDPSRTPYLAVVSPSTHDTSTIRGWWKEIHYDKKQRFIYDQLRRHATLEDDCPPWLAEAIIEQHLHSWSMWSIFLLQDLFAMDENTRVEDPDTERINHPENPQHYWRYRSHIAVEDLMKHELFNERLKNLIAASGR